MAASISEALLSSIQLTRPFSSVVFLIGIAAAGNWAVLAFWVKKTRQKNEDTGQRFTTERGSMPQRVVPASGFHGANNRRGVWSIDRITGPYPSSGNAGIISFWSRLKCAEMIEIVSPVWYYNTM